ncbi:MAG: pilin [bacterium]|nr:pilin [bacterium]
MKRILMSLMVLTMLVAGVGILVGTSVSAQTSKDAVCEGLGATAGGAGCSDPAGGSGVLGAVRTVINILSLVVGIAAVIMIIVGGFKYVTSGGDSGKTASAKNTIIYALVGVVIVALAQTLVFFVINRSSNST